MSQQIDTLCSKSNTIQRFCMDWLLIMYETLAARDVKTAMAFQSILTMHHGEKTLNCHVCDTVAQLETTIGRLAFTDPSPPSISLAEQPNAPAESAQTTATLSEGLKKRGLSPGSDIDGTSKHQKV